MPSFDKAYNVVWYRLAVWLVPKGLRKPLYLLLLKSIMWPLIVLHDVFMRYRSAKLYQVTITGQVCYLKRLLNDKYDSSARRIHIGDATWYLPWFLFQAAEAKPRYLKKAGEGAPDYLRRDGEAGGTKDDFVIMVPASIGFYDAEMISLIDSYKLFGTRYTIQRF